MTRLIDPVYGPQWCQDDCPDCPDKPGPCHWTCGNSSALRAAQEAWRIGQDESSRGLADTSSGAVEVERRQDQPEPCNTAAPTNATSVPDPRRAARERAIAELFRCPPWVIGITPRPRWWGRVAYYICHPRSLR